MLEAILIVFFLFVFFYAKSRADQLKDEIDHLRSMLESGARAGHPLSSEAKPVQAAGAVQLKPENHPAAVLAAKPVSAAPDKKTDDGDLEFKVGGKMFTGIGVLAVIFAIGFFLRYAFQNDLITEFARVALGVFAGLVLLGAGEYTRGRFPGYGQALTGGGLGVLYLSFYAAFTYDLVIQPAAFFMMIMVTAAGIMLSLRQNSMALAIFSQAGGFLTPLLIDSGSGNPHVLFLYVALLNLAVFALAFYKLWQPLSLLSFAGTAVTFFYWHSQFYDSAQFTAAQAYLTLFFVIFLCIPFIQYFVKKASGNSWDLSLVAANPFLYFVMSYVLIDPLHHDLMGWFTIVLGSLYCALAVAVGGEDERASLFRHFLLTAGFVLLAVAVPIQLDGKWIAVAWTAEALAFLATGFRLKFSVYRILGNLLMFVALMRILFFDSRLAEDASPIANARFMTYVIFLAAAVGAAYIYRKKKSEIGEDERSMFSLLALEGAFAGLVGPTLEIYDFPEYFGSQWYPVFWTIGGLVAGALSFRLRSVALRAVTYLTFAISFFRLIFFESYLAVARNAHYIPVFNKRVFGFLASAAAIRYFLSLLRANKDKVSSEEFRLFQPMLFAGFHLLLLWVISAEVIGWCDWQEAEALRPLAVDYDNLKNVLLSVAWTLYGAGLLVVGIVKKTTYERFAALSLFTLVIIKVFLVDTADLNDLYRFFSFITLGGILLLAGYLYYRYRDRIGKFVKGN